MNEFKGTPGPWTIVSDSPDGSEIEALAPSTFWAFVSYDTPEAERTPNAHLIAAAPELLEALQELRDLMQGVIDGDYAPDSVTLQIADAAIRKALGVRKP